MRISTTPFTSSRPSPRRSKSSFWPATRNATRRSRSTTSGAPSRRHAARSWKSSRVLARFDKGDPALIQVPVGKGLLFVLTSGWQPADSQLALSSKFVPLLYSLLDLSGGVKAQLAQYVVGDPVSLAATNPAQEFILRTPDGTEVRVPG